ncbi:cytochrome P450 [Dichomitus squalens]|nr:cytochrome P450 [Dichomitus squalens]
MSLLSSLDTWMLALVVLSFSGALLCIAYPDRLVTTNARPDLPGPTGHPLFGNLLQAIPWQGRILDWFDHLLSSYGPFCTFTLLPWGRGILINRPEWLAHIKQADMKAYSRGPYAIEIFTEFPGGRTPVASEGAQWRLARKSIYPIFTVKSFTEHVSHAMNEIVPMARALLLSASKRDVPIDWSDFAGRIAITIFTLSHMNHHANVLQGDVTCLDRDDPLRDALAVLNRVSARRLFNPAWRFTELLNGDRFRFSRARSYIRGLVDQIVRARQAHATEKSKETAPIHADFLSVLLEDPAFNDPILIRDIMVTMLFAGRDNTQNVLAWALYSIMAAPEWIDRLREEATANRHPTHEVDYSEVSRYHVHLAVFFETVRLWPGLPKNARLALQDDVLPALPEYGLPAVKIEKGDYVFWSDYHMMRSSEVWGPTANMFDPGRHLDSEGHFTKPAAPKFNCFGAGPRFCPGQQLVMYEFVAALAGILPYFDFAPSERPTTSGLTYEKPELAEAFTASLTVPLIVDVRVREGIELGV